MIKKIYIFVILITSGMRLFSIIPEGKIYIKKYRHKMPSKKYCYEQSTEMYQCIKEAIRARQKAHQAIRQNNENLKKKCLTREKEYLIRAMYWLKNGGIPNYRPRPVSKSRYKKPVSLPTPLMLAARHGYFCLSEKLLDKGAKIDIHVRGTTALIEATTHEHKEIVELLLDKGARIDIGPWNMTAIHETIRLGKLEMLNVLLAKRKDAANIKGKAKIAPLIFAINSAKATGCSDAALTLINSGASINKRTLSVGQMPLFRAVKLRNHRIVEKLRDNGVKQIPIDGKMPIKVALEQGNIGIMRTLLP